jgi:tetratricopeptide (TPR) repeat protein
MRILFFICIVFVFSVSAQTPFIRQTFEAANAAAQKQQYEQAIEKYQATILRADVERLSETFLAKIHFNIGVCFYHLKKTNEAVAEFTEAVKLSKRGYQKAFYALGMAQKDLKDWRAAASALRDALKIDKTDGEAWFDLGLIYLEEKNFAAARKAFENSVKYKSVNEADAHNNLGVIAALENDWTAAETKFITALTVSSNKSVEARNNLQFCQSYKQNSHKNLLAKFEFSRKTKQSE